MVLDLNEVNFALIRAGKKSIEVRAPSINRSYSDLKIGEVITLHNEETEENLLVTIVSVQHFRTLEDLFEKLDLKKIGPTTTDKESAIAKTLAIPSYKEKIDKGGVWAIEFKLKT